MPLELNQFYRLCFSLIATLLLFLFIPANCVRIAHSKQIVKILNDPSLYDKHLTPTQLSDEPITVTIGMYVEGMSSVRGQTMDFHCDIYLEQIWQDARLAHNNADRVLVKDPGLLEKMWHPDLYFANANSAKTFDVTSPNFFLWVFPNGTIHYDMRISLTVLCNMDFTKYPLDTQQCDMRILSYAYTTDQLLIRWRKIVPISMNSELKLPDMNISAVEAISCGGTYATGSITFISTHIDFMPKMKQLTTTKVSHEKVFCAKFWSEFSDRIHYFRSKSVCVDVNYIEPAIHCEDSEWSCAKAVFKLRREKMHHILQNYVPTVLIVIISWFSFWLDVDSVPGRVSLCITTLLTLATHANSARLSLPQVSYAKAIDVWLEACLGFVFGVLIEFTVVNYLSRQRDEGCCDESSSAINEISVNLTPLNDIGMKKQCSECEYFVS